MPEAFVRYLGLDVGTTTITALALDAADRGGAFRDVQEAGRAMVRYGEGVQHTGGTHA